MSGVTPEYGRVFPHQAVARPKICNPSAAHGTLVVATVTGTDNSFLVDHLGNSLSKAILFPNVFKLHHTKLTGP